MATTMQIAPTCRTCGAPLEGGSAECPNCLFQLAVDVGTVERVCAPPFTAPDPERLAALMPDFEFVDLLGRGGMGAVYKVRQTRLNRMAAMKVLPPERAADPEFVERFFREAQALAQLSHPNIVDVYDMGQRGPYLYILMEYVEGKPLRESIRNPPLEPAEALRLTSLLCGALQRAHDLGIIHRDIKPENILVLPDGTVKLLDFGLVKLSQDSRLDRFTLTEINLRVGTPQYMAPEQMSGSLDVDHRVDIYATGVLLYEMLCGAPPAVNYSPPSRKAAVDPRVDRVVERALRESPDERYRRADELRRDIEHIVRTPRRRALVIGTVAAVLIAAALGAYLWHRSATADHAPPPGTPIDGIPIAVVPFDAAGAREHQERWAKHLGVPVEWTNSIGMAFALIPPGEYTRGIPDAEVAEWLAPFTPENTEPSILALVQSSYPAHRVRLTRAFYMAVTETTQGQYERVTGDLKGFFRVDGAGAQRLADPDTQDFPVETLPWFYATVFCEKLSAMEGITNGSAGYRLPTEGEWEFALRGGAATRYWYGNELDREGCFEISAVHTPVRPRRVASLRPNPFGLYDMAGNVSEYCSDWWSPDEFKRYADRCAVNPTGPEDGARGGYQRVVRGGHFGGLDAQHSNRRSRNDPGLWTNTLGFRTAIDADTVARILRRSQTPPPSTRPSP